MNKFDQIMRDVEVCEKELEGKPFQGVHILIDDLKMLLPVVSAAQALARFGFESSDIYGRGDSEYVKDWQSWQDKLYAALAALQQPEDVQ